MEKGKYYILDEVDLRIAITEFINRKIFESSDRPVYADNVIFYRNGAGAFCARVYSEDKE